MIDVTVGDGKYRVIQDESGKLKALRHGKEWRDCCGDNLIYCLASEVESLRAELGKRMTVFVGTNTDFDGVYKIEHLDSETVRLTRYQ